MSHIAARTLAQIAGAYALSGLPGRGRAEFAPSRVILVSAVAIILLPSMLLAGLTWSAALPATAAVLAAFVTGHLIWKEIFPQTRGGQMVEQRAATTPETASLLNGLPGLVTRHDSAGQLISAHGADRRSFGLAERSEAGAYVDLIHVGGRIAFLTAVDRLRQGEARAEAEFLFAGGAAETGYRPVRISMTRENDFDGGFRGFVAQTLDIAGEAALRDDATHWQCEARSAADAKTRFLAAVSHELRTPLNAILGFSDILIGEYFGRFENERQREYVGLINQSGQHLLAVVNTMLDMSKIEAGRYELVKEPFDISAAVRTVDEMLALQAKTRGVILTTRVARSLAEVVADRRAIQQVLINLANNAIKFTNEGGVVAIDATCEGRSLKITVSDTGIGIPADKLAAIGKPFMQVQNDYARRYEGTGLGLALVKGLVALHGGTFTIESQEGQGTVITVTVPMNGEGEAGAETFEFPPRLKESNNEETGENRHGIIAQAKIA